MLILVIIIPYITGEPWFSKLCPLGMIQAGIPLTIIDQSLRSLIGPLFYLKIIILVAVVAAGIVIERFWCRVICPLGAIFGLFNSTSLVKMKLNQQKCSDCGICVKICPAHIDIGREANSLECIRCLKCSSKCKNITFDLH
ncbi:MAG: putative electron transport protein YccM [candidate division WS2 bacterium]|nr:putative electron transport protein YccM [Candidatus Lithacetigena glycinireducens]